MRPSIRLAAPLFQRGTDDLGLAAALRWLADQQAARGGLRVQFRAAPLERRLDPAVETACFRVAQEALTNVVRHAKASHVDVVLESRDDSMLVIVEDDGQGFDIHLARNGGHLGLLGMQERTEMLGGTLTIESTPEMGTTLFVEVPYVHPNIARR